MNGQFKGLSVNLDTANQVEYNRRKNVEQDKKLATISSQVNQLLNQAPAGFLPSVYYGLTRGDNKYRFIEGYDFEQIINGNIGDAFALTNPQETENYITAIAVKTSDTQMQIIIKGDYNIYTDTFTAINMRTGEETQITISEAIALEAASYLGDYDANLNKEKQITVLYSLELRKDNVVFASIDYSGDGVYNWVSIGGYINGKDGKSIYNISAATYASVSAIANVGDMLLAIENFTQGNVTFGSYDLYSIDTISPLSVTLLGNIKGPQGIQGLKGETGETGANGLTPYIQDDYWYIGGVNTGVVAVGKDGENGEDGVSFSIQSGLFSTPENYGKPNNIGPENQTLQQLPTLPQTDITGKGYMVYDGLTTPLSPYYDLYFANNGDTSWTIISHFNGQPGQNGENGKTPYIQDNNWFIDGVNTGVAATGPQGEAGEGFNYMGEWVAQNEYFKNDVVTYATSNTISSYILITEMLNGSTTPPPADTINWQVFTQGTQGPQGPQGPQGEAGSDASVTIDAALSQTSTNPVQNRVVTTNLNNKLNKLEFEWNKELAFGETGLLCIGKFPIYDTNLTIDISSTTSRTYNGRLIIACQNYLIQEASVYGDSDNNLTPKLFIKPTSPSDQIIEIYFQPETYSKNIISIKGCAVRGTATDIVTNIPTLPSNATVKPTNKSGGNVVLFDGNQVVSYTSELTITDTLNMQSGDLILIYTNYGIYDYYLSTNGVQSLIHFNSAVNISSTPAHVESVIPVGVAYYNSMLHIKTSQYYIQKVYDTNGSETVASQEIRFIVNGGVSIYRVEYIKRH